MIEFKDSNEDMKLVEEWKNGNGKSFEKLVKKYGKKIMGYIRSKWFNDNDIDDIAQDSWIKIHSGIAKYDPSKSSFYNFAKLNVKDILWNRYKGRKLIIVDKEILIQTLHFPDINYETDDIIGENPIIPNNPEQSYLLYSEMKELLLTACTRGGPLHQIICFLYNKSLSGWGPKSIVEKLSDYMLSILTEKLVKDYKKETMLPIKELEECFAGLREKVCKKLIDEIEKYTPIRCYLPGEIEKERFEREIISNTPEEKDRDFIRDVYLFDESRDKYILNNKYRNKADRIYSILHSAGYKTLLDKVTGNTILPDYYGKKPVHDVEVWTNRVKQRIYDACCEHFV